MDALVMGLSASGRSLQNFPMCPVWLLSDHIPVTHCDLFPSANLCQGHPEVSVTVTYNSPQGQELSACSSQCLYAILSVSTNSWVVMETRPAQWEPPQAPVTHPALHSQTLSHPGHTTPHKVGVTGYNLPSHLLPRAGFLLALRPSPVGTAHGGSSSLEKGRGVGWQQPPQTYGDTQGDITLQTQIYRVRGLTERNWNNSEGCEFGHSALFFQ